MRAAPGAADRGGSAAHGAAAGPAASSACGDRRAPLERDGSDGSPEAEAASVATSTRGCDAAGRPSCTESSGIALVTPRPVATPSGEHFASRCACAVRAADVAPRAPAERRRASVFFRDSAGPLLNLFIVF
ncbi:putative lipoprotein [Burkholderia pseudomallei Pakistan 9]|nr:putative lipoprotein [Burkholderia pseudomallei Pakistan 9]